MGDYREGGSEEGVVYLHGFFGMVEYGKCVFFVSCFRSLAD